MKAACLTFFAVFLVLLASTAPAEAEEQPEKYYLFIGQFDQLPAKGLIENPLDTAPGYAEELEQLGGKLHGYYFSVKEPTMYAIISFPSHKEAAAQVYQRRGFGGIAREMEMIEIFTSEQMVEVFELAKQHTEFVKKRFEKAGE